MIKPKIICIIQARMGSTRLPGKTLIKVNGQTLLEYCARRVGLAKKIAKVVVATTTNPADNAIAELCRSIGIDCFRGSETDVLSRYYHCALKYPNYDAVVRVTADDPLTDPDLIDQLVNLFVTGDYDYASNIEVGRETYPDGLDVEIFSRRALTQAFNQATQLFEREHVTPWMKDHPSFQKGYLASPVNLAHYRLAVDNPPDVAVISFLINHTQPDDPFEKYIALLDAHPEIRRLNSAIGRNEGFKKSLAKENKPI